MPRDSIEQSRIDPTEDGRYSESSGTEFSELSVDAQRAIRHLLDEHYVNRITVYNGERDHFGVTATQGSSAGSVAEELNDAGLSLWIAQVPPNNDNNTVIIEGYNDNE